MKPIIGYRRVSTERQGRSGLGLEAQDAALQAFSKQTGRPILKVYTEVETGKNSERVELARAISHAKRSQSTLVAAKLDRLSRNAGFLLALIDSKVEVCFADNPHANQLTIGVLAIFAQHEAKAISDRTKAALAAYKARGGKLGSTPGNCPIPAAARKRGAKKAGEVVARLADEAYSDLAFIVEWRKSGMTQQQICDKLNEIGYTSRRGRKFSQGLISRILRLRFNTK